MKKYLIITGMLAVMFAISCKKESGGSNTDDNVQVNCSTVTFSGDIAPLISSKCATSGCHNASSSNGPGPLINYASIFASRFSIQTSVNNNRMPQGGPPLTAAEKAKLKCWIDAGAPNN
ncbi:MAG TPA: hypothetical protein VFV46_03920 [Lacibacter sp.]|nr:hypothetical protein [Lacibacter sp.]